MPKDQVRGKREDIGLGSYANWCPWILPIPEARGPDRGTRQNISQAGAPSGIETGWVQGRIYTWVLVLGTTF